LLSGVMTFEPPPSPEDPPSEPPELPDDDGPPELLELLVLLPSSPVPASLLLLELLRHALIASAQTPAAVTENLMRNIGLVTDAPQRKKDLEATAPRPYEGYGGAPS
jgi:hypothetical protein